VLFYSLPDEQTATLRRLVRLLRHARTEFAACKARFRNTLLPALAPAGAPLPPAVIAALPAPLQLLLPAAQRRALPAVAAALPAAFACDLIDLAARVGGVRTRLAALEAALVTVATPLPAYRLLLTIPGLGPTLAAILVAELGDLAWDQPVQSAPQARGPRYHLGGDGAVDRDGPDLPGGAPAAALGALPGGLGGGPDRGGARAPRPAAGEAGGGSPRLLQGERGVGREAPPAGLGRLAEWAPLRPRAGRPRPRGPAGDRLARGADRPPRGPTCRPGAIADRGTERQPGWSKFGHPGRAPGERPTRRRQESRPPRLRAGGQLPVSRREAARGTNVEGPPGHLVRDRGAPLSLPQLGLGRLSASDSDAAT
jgi:hypothetical protein